MDEARIVECQFRCNVVITSSVIQTYSSVQKWSYRCTSYPTVRKKTADPSPQVSIDFYGKTYGHLLAPGESPFLHYVRTGRAAGLMGAPEDLGSWPPMLAPEPARLGRPARNACPSRRPTSS